MQVVRDRAGIAAITDEPLRTVIEQRVQSLSEFDAHELDELATFVVVQPGDTLEALDAQLGFSVLDATPELIEEHAGYFEIVFVVSDDGYGIELFVPVGADVPPELLAMCTA